MFKLFCGALLALFCVPASAELLTTLASAVTTFLGGGAGAAGAAAAAGGLAASKLLKPKTPTVQKPAVMPTADDEAVKAAKRRQIAEMQYRGGRASTVLSEGDKLGG